MQVAIVLAIVCGAVALRLWLGQNIMKNQPSLKEVMGRRKLVVDTFDSGVVYRNGLFERILPSGSHWINTKDLSVIAVEMRPRVLRMAEVMATADRRRVRLSMLMRLQIADARAAVESAVNFHDEHAALALASIRKLALAWSFRDLNLREPDFSAAGLGELLGELPETDERDIGFKTH